jgi:hypothetical protein
MQGRAFNLFASGNGKIDVDGGLTAAVHEERRLAKGDVPRFM